MRRPIAIALAALMPAVAPDPAEAHDVVEWRGARYHMLLTAEETGGSLALIEVVQPAGDGAPAHVHDDADETFHVLDGTVLFQRGEERITAGPGESVFIPRGTEHSFLALGEGEVRTLVVLTPGGFEGFFAAVAAEGLALPDDIGRIDAVAAEYHLRITGPGIAVD